MSHEIETMMYAGETPWHGLGTYVGENNLTSKEALIASGLNWGVRKDPMFIETSAGQLQLVPDNFAMVRDSDESILGVVGSRYEPLQNEDGFSFLDSLVEDGSMRYHTAGSLRNGQRVFMLAKIGNSEIVPNDHIDHFLFLFNSHDGSGALRILFTPIRVVCANTARMALQGRKDGIYLKHTSNMQNKVEQARDILGLATAKFDHYAQELREFSKINIFEKDMKELTNLLLPSATNEEEVATRLKNEREKLLATMQGDGIGLGSIVGNGFGLYSSVVEFANYKRAARGENAQSNRFEASLFGAGDEMVQNTISYLTAKLAA